MFDLCFKMDNQCNIKDINEVSQGIIEINWDGNSTVVLDHDINKTNFDITLETELILGMDQTHEISEIQDLIENIDSYENDPLKESNEDEGIQSLPYTSNNSDSLSDQHKNSELIEDLSQIGDICLGDLTNFSTVHNFEDSAFNSCESSYSNNEIIEILKPLKEQLYGLKTQIEIDEKQNSIEIDIMRRKLNKLNIYFDQILNISDKLFNNEELNNDEKIEKLIKNLDKINQKNEEFQKLLNDKENICEQLQKSIQFVTKESDVVNYELKQVKSELNDLKKELNDKNLLINEQIISIQNCQHLIKLDKDEIHKLKDIESLYIKLLGEHRCLNSKYEFLERDYTFKQESLIKKNTDLELIINKNETTINDMTNIINNETQKYNEINEKNQNLQILYSNLKKNLDNCEQNIKMIQMDNKIYQDQLLDKEILLDNIHQNVTNIFSIDDVLSQHVPATNDNLIESFTKLRQRILSMSQLCKTIEIEKKKANNMEIECNILNRQIQQKESKLEDISKKYNEQCQTMLDHNFILTQENNKLIERIKQFEENVKTTEERDCESLQKYIQELKIEIVDKNAKISSLELHVESCCNFNRRKAQEYKNELYEVKNQLKYARRECTNLREAQFNYSLKTLKAPNVETGVQTEEIQNDTKIYSLGIVERHKIRDLEEKVLKLEQDKALLKKICTKRAETIKMLQSQ